MSKRPLRFIDLFAGAGGLSEGFVRAGYTPVAHIEMDKDACNTLRTREAFHYLKSHDSLDIYTEYIKNKKEKEDGQKLWAQVPRKVIDTVIHATIGTETINGIFEKVDQLKGESPIDIIIGGPPCQAYSIVGRARMGKNVLEDPRNELYKFYVEFLERYQPRMFVFENVLGILSALKGKPLQDLKESVDRAGYHLELKEQIASDYGVLQKRHRVIIVGWKKNTLNSKREEYHYPELKKIVNNYKVYDDLFADLPLRVSGEGKLAEAVQYTKSLEDMKYLEEFGIRNPKINFTTQHIARPHNYNDRVIYCKAVKLWREQHVKFDYSKLPTELQSHKNTKSFLDRYSVVDPDGCCHTVVAHICKDGHYYIYPSLNPTVETARSITVREAARLQSFPDDFFFEGSRSAAFKQIGNAVPVLLSYAIAKELKKQL
jgi:DNA (cytosine-5)-methyltransferase 1